MTVVQAVSDFSHKGNMIYTITRFSVEGDVFSAIKMNNKKT